MKQTATKSVKLVIALFVLSFPTLSQAQQVLITGVVTDRNTTAPIANAQVFFYGTAYGTVFTDGTGRYTFTAGNLTSFGGAISGNLYVGATGYFEAPPVFVSDLANQPSLPVVQNFTLRPGGTVIQGVVRDASTGLGISGAMVSFNRNPMSTFLGGVWTAGVQTNVDGSYAIDSSYFNESGLSSGFSVYLQVNATGYLGETQPLNFTSYPVTQNFSLGSTSGPLITGVVTDRNTGQPIANAQLFFYGTAYGFTNTDSNGQYTFLGSQLNLFGGAISGNLYVGTTGYFEAPPVFVSDLANQPGLPVVQNFTLRPGGTVIQGIVRDASTGLGISGAMVSFNRNPMSTFLGGVWTAGVQTNVDGSYAIDSSYFNESGLSSGFSVYLQVNATGYLGETQPLNFTSYPVTQNFSLGSTSGPLITGVVTDRNTGQPIANAQLFFYGTAYGFTNTDSNGQYTFLGSQLNLFGGAISGNLYVGTTGYFEAPPVFVSDLANQPGLPVVQNFTLRPGGTVIQGVVRDASTGLGISGAMVSFNRNPMSTFLGGVWTAGVQTNVDGSYAIDSSYFNESGLSSGFSAYLQVNATGYLGETQPLNFTSYPVTQNFSLISLNQSPTGRAGPDKTGIVGEALQFEGSASSDPDGFISNYQWTFGDGSTGTGAIVTHTYASGGTFTVTLTVTDNSGATGQDTAIVTVQTVSQSLQTLSDTVRSLNLAQGISNSLDAKLQAILDALQAVNAGQRQDAINKLLAFINAVEAQRGKELTNAQADMLIAQAQRIVAVL